GDRHHPDLGPHLRRPHRGHHQRPRFAAGRRRRPHPPHPGRPRTRRPRHQDLHHPTGRRGRRGHGPGPGEGGRPRRGRWRLGRWGFGGGGRGAGGGAGGLGRGPEAVAGMLELGPAVERLAERLVEVETLVVSGRGFAYSTALEVALKLKETCYLTAVGLSYADLVHGPIAIVDAGTPALLVAAADGPMLPDMTALARRIAEAGADVYGIGGDATFAAACKATLPGPPLPEYLAPFALIVPGQLLAEALARAKGIDPDAPRGLRKVTQTGS